MELQSTQPNARMRRNQKLSLEEYLYFIDSHKQNDLTVPLLNQIIVMHGFRKIHKTPKKVLIDAVNSIDLMDPTRSTLNDEGVSSCAFMTLEETIRDLADLEWQECSVTSIQTLNSVNYDLLLRNADASSSKSKAKRSRKRRKLLTLGGVGGDGSASVAAATDGCGNVGGSQSACFPVTVGQRRKKLVAKRRKSNVRGASDIGATVGDFSQSPSTFHSIAPY